MDFYCVSEPPFSKRLTIFLETPSVNYLFVIKGEATPKKINEEI
jgi:hypothetical protein